MAPPALLCIVALLAVARIVEPLDCSYCISDTVTCTNQTVTCEKGQDTCVSMTVQHSLTKDKSSTSGSSKSCAIASKNVNNSFMFDFGEGRLLNFASLLCNGKDCEASFSQVYLESYWNGKYCPRCYRSGYSSCEDNGTVYCSGDYIQCAAIHGKVTEGSFTIPFAAKGCARGPLKDLFDRLPLEIVSRSYNYKLDGMSFQPANGALAAMRRVTFSLDSRHLGPQVAFLFPCFLGIFAGKILS